MKTRHSSCRLTLYTLSLLTLAVFTCANSKVTNTPARVLAKQFGATQFHEERYERSPDCDEHKHRLKKRSSDEDVDYEVYQGVVGRPGIDFPIYPRIPKTSFSCRSFGNGYFADMETDCQVFHICEEGRKISFLCPNGTIFQQSELTCDWWFKVNCLGSPGYYAESAEILNKQRIQRVRPSVPVQGFNIVGGGLNIKPKITSSPRTTTKHSSKSDRRIDSNEEPSLESIDFDDVSGEKQLKGQKPRVISNIDNNSNDNESQITAESASFVDSKSRNSYIYDKPNVAEVERKSSLSRSNDKNNERHNDKNKDRYNGRNNDKNNDKNNERNNDRNYDKNNDKNNDRNYDKNNDKNNDRNYDKNNDKNNERNNDKNIDSNNDRYNDKTYDRYNERQSTSSSSAKRNGPRSSPGYEPTERARNGQRGQQRFKEEKRAFNENIDGNGSGISNGGSSSGELDSYKNSQASKKVIKPASYTDTSSRSLSSGISADDDLTTTITDDLSTSTRSTLASSKATTSSFLNSPSGTYTTAKRLEHTKTTAPFYTPTVPSVVKSKSPDAKVYYIKSQKGGGASKSNAALASSSLLEHSVTPKSIAVATAVDQNSTPSVTQRSFIIGMRHYYDSTPESYRTSVNSKERTNLDKQKHNTREYLPTTTPASTGPTYLPKNAVPPPKANADAGGELFLFAPIPSAPSEGDAVSRNVNEMLKTMSLINNKLEDADEKRYQAQTREGLEIPPSSGPDVLVSLAKYFENEPNGAKINSLNALEAAKQEKQEKVLSSRSKSNTSTTRTSIAYSTPTAAIQQSSSSLKPSDNTVSITTEATPNLSANADDIKASLLSEKTVTKYSTLFGLREAQGRQATDPSSGLLSNNNATDSEKETSRQSSFPQIGTTDATLRQLAEKPESRKIAHVFSNALNTYLEDPNSFRKQLAAARPTEPPVGGKTNFEIVTTTDASLFKSGTAASYLPTQPTPAVDTTTTEANIASEINNKFDHSTTEIYEFTTYRPTLNSRDQKLGLELSEELLPPSQDSGERDESLQREQTQSFVNSRNNVNLLPDKTQKYQITTENPWNQISQADFLDPLTINTGLMHETRTTTASPYTYLPKQSTTTTTTAPPKPTTYQSKEKVRPTTSQRLETARSHVIYGSAEVTTERTQQNESWQDIFNKYEVPVETLPSSSGLQRIANKLFGGLNETEALHLQNVMRQAEHNRQVLSLLLLLIQTCDDQNGKALERSRKHLINALIDMDGRLSQGKTAYQKTTPSTVTTTTTRVPVTTYRRSNEIITTSTLSYPSTTTDLPSTTVATTVGAGGSDETTRFEIRVEDPEEEANYATSTIASSTNSESNSDKRALELLKSLYSLASKFTSRR